MIWWALAIAAIGFLVWKRLPVWRRISAELDAEEAALAPARRRSLDTLGAGDPGGLAANAPAAGPGTPARPASPPVDEKTSIVLRRQIPVRFDEPRRSWIGGLPMMPDGVEWPRGVSHEQPEDGERPLNFVAQIACADLPRDLWGGLGPREGWLLFFLNPNLGFDYDTRSFRVVHTRELGAERQPPADIGRVYDGIYTGPDYKSYLPLEDVPTVWRHWPVDLVEVPNQARIEGQRTLVAPPDFASTLYGGATVASDTLRSAKVEPFSWRCLHFGLLRAETALSASAEQTSGSSSLRERLSEPGMFEDIVPHLDRREKQFWDGPGAALREPDPPELDDQARQQRVRIREKAAERARTRDRVAALLEAHPTLQALLGRLDEAEAARARWRSEAHGRLASLRSRLEAQGLDTALEPAEWQAIRAELEQDCHVDWALAWGVSEGASASVTPEERSVCAFDFMKAAIEEGTRQVAADYYVDPRLRPVLPDDVVEVMEPHWRQLYENRPHRIGGYHDGLQSDAEIGPQTDVLLLQLASDDAMQWVWGDSGAFYVFIDTAALAAGDLGAIQPQLECH